MARPLDPFTGDAALPARTRVVVIGGGVIGCSGVDHRHLLAQYRKARLLRS